MTLHFEKEDIEKFFVLKKSGNKGWYNTTCPYCGKENHLGINFNGIGTFNCFRCGEKGTIYKLLKFIGKQEIIDDKKVTLLDKKFDEELFYEITNNTLELQQYSKIIKPLGFKEVLHSDYIEQRGITEDIFYINDVGITNLETNLKHRLIFMFKYNNSYVGYIARTILNSTEIEKIEERTQKKYLRYVNSKNTDFSKYLFGITELNETTKTVILVEGIFDKFKIDTELDLYYFEDVKCCACFGKKISDYQILLLQRHGVENIILMFDRDAIKESKEYGNYLNQYFNVQIALCNKKDPGEMNEKELRYALKNMQSPVSFSSNYMNLKKII